ncbi:anthocyanidin 5,3-O-glucosyltransferase-like [Triticum dicoccoides]|uniref:anthocyanidin 5,3-O-glucosyltransferase-like n=1 Tax=Triticum dicoccoides TaxID=85692 RepID=UPI0018918589|nr:anthocyanidin 5,3-O-glucosyltransferase-like [Triticum dicoccoides]
MDAATTTRKQVVLYPAPGLGHLVSMAELGKILAARGLAVTVIIIKPPYDTGAIGPFLAGVTAANPSISFHCLPPVELPLVDSVHLEVVTFEAARTSNPQLRDFLAGASPAILVVDFFCSVTVDVATELDIPAYYFFTCCTETLAIFLYLPVLHAQSTASFRDMGDELVHVTGIPSFPATHCFKPLMDRDDATYRAFLRVSSYLCCSQGIIVNTFRSLEQRAVDAISAGLCTPPDLPTPPVYCIGPLIKSEEVGVKHGQECLAWLDTQPKAILVFLCFGSRSLFNANQTRELAIGLEASGKRFLWVVRSPPRDIDDPAKKLDKLLEPDLEALLLEGFLERTKGTGLVVKSWAPQCYVLAHDAVGAFVMHYGWNSVLETLMAGVPMLAWPLYAEQRVNRVFLEKELGLAVAVEGYEKEAVQANEVASKVRWMIESDGGRVLRERTLAAMRLGKEALLPGGESVVTLTQLVES